MKTVVACGAVSLVLCTLAGCGSSAQDEAIKERIRCWNEASDVFASIQDEKSAAAARDRLDGIIERMMAINRKSKTLRPATEAEEREIRQKNEDVVRKAGERLNQQMERAASVPGGGEVVYDFNYKVRQYLN